ncbi:HD domain-containing protein [Candidatus Poribacteria bacterium]|nr:HD domain-containing protein [Candidatus Poribacteria bacterium]
MDYQPILKELEDLTVETFSLWDHNRVGFQWRHYTLNHTLRVRDMCLELGRKEGADLTQLAFAATLHDITKKYDGKILADEKGNRVLDEYGFWVNETLLPNPNKSNIVTKLYSENNQQGTVHSVSGAFIAKKLLESYGLPDDFNDAVSSIIRAHVRPPKLTPEQYDELYGKVESRILYDADTMDANVGYTAFYRNVHIHSYGAIQRGGFDLSAYVDNLPRWIDTKYSFVDDLLTESGRDIGAKRQERNKTLYQMLSEEKQHFDLNLKYGLLGVIDYFVKGAEDVSGTDDPNCREQMSYLERKWIPERKEWAQKENGDIQKLVQQSINRVVDFCNLMEAECSGKA